VSKHNSIDAKQDAGLSRTNQGPLSPGSREVALLWLLIDSLVRQAKAMIEASLLLKILLFLSFQICHQNESRIFIFAFLSLFELFDMKNCTQCMGATRGYRVAKLGRL
jgi:hypothetical protein